MIVLDFVIRANKRYYPQTLLEECKYEIKNNKMGNLINDDLEQSSSDESDSESDNGSDNGSDMMNLVMNLMINLMMIHLLKGKTVF